MILRSLKAARSTVVKFPSRETAQELIYRYHVCAYSLYPDLKGGFSRGTMSKIENGLTSPEVYTLVRIAEVLVVQPKKLLEFD